MKQAGVAGPWEPRWVGTQVCALQRAAAAAGKRTEGQEGSGARLGPWKGARLIPGTVELGPARPGRGESWLLVTPPEGPLLSEMSR